MFAPSDHRPLAAHIWNKEPDGFYVEPEWCSARLFEVEKFDGVLWDPACGIGRIVKAARRAGYRTIATDIVDRGCPQFDGVLDFLKDCGRIPAANIVTNPPFTQCDRFVHRVLELGSDKVAMIWLARRLNAARWLADTPLARVYLLTPRPSMPPGHVILAGEKPSGGTHIANREGAEYERRRLPKLGALKGKDKEGSRQKALELFPHAQHLLARKKDHQRAEAMLIDYFGAWFLMPAESAPVEAPTAVETVS